MYLAFGRYEKENKGRKTIKAQTLWYAIIESQTETGTPYMLYKDHCNKKSNQKNLGTIKCSNLCTEIVEYSSADEVSFLMIIKEEMRNRNSIIQQEKRIPYRMVQKL